MALKKYGTVSFGLDQVFFSLGLSFEPSWCSELVLARTAGVWSETGEVHVAITHRSGFSKKAVEASWIFSKIIWDMTPREEVPTLLLVI